MICSESKLPSRHCLGIDLFYTVIISFLCEDLVFHVVYLDRSDIGQESTQTHFCRLIDTRQHFRGQGDNA